MKRAKVTEAKYADDNHRVLTVVGGQGTYRREPCGGCPWRKDQAGTFPAEAFRISAYTAYDMSMEQFACHESGTEKPATCAGFLLNGASHNLSIRIKSSLGQVDLFLIKSDVELFDSYREMAEANGVSPDDPVLRRCR